MKWNILLIWPSWAWKTTISKEILKIDNLYQSFIADTSRKIRIWEIDKVDYNFISSEEIIWKSLKIKDYLIEEYFYNYYWYNLTNFINNNRFILTPWIKVAEEILKKKNEYWICISILLNIDFNTFNNRLKNRWESSDEIKKRILSLDVLDFSNKVDLIINWNDSINNINNILIECLIKN